jgi:hypothetical protein
VALAVRAAAEVLARATGGELNDIVSAAGNVAVNQPDPGAPAVNPAGRTP